MIETAYVSLQVVLIENDIDARPFTSQVLACLPPLPWSVSAEDVANPIRQDLRNIRVFSVDPPGKESVYRTVFSSLFFISIFVPHSLFLEFPLSLNVYSNISKGAFLWFHSYLGYKFFIMLVQDARILMTHCIVHFFQMDILKLESVSFLHLSY